MGSIVADRLRNNRHMLRKWVLLVAAVHMAQAQSIDTFFKDTFERMLRDDPEFATGIGRHEYDDRWTDWSKAGRDSRRDFLQRSLSELGKFPKASMSPENQLTARIVEYDFQSRLDAWDLSTHLLRVGQLFGFHNRVYVLMDRMPAHSVKGYKNLVSRLNAIPMLVDQNIGIMDEAIASKVMQPKVVNDLVVAQITAQMNQDAEHSALLEAFRKFPSNIPADEQKKLLADATGAYNSKFLPAWHKLHDYMGQTYSAHVRPTVSLNSIPNGRADYAVLVRALTTTNLSAQEIHSLGEKEVARIEGEMKSIVAETGFQGTLDQFQEHLKDSPDQHFQTKDEMLEYCRNIAKIIEPELPNHFHHIPMLLYGVRPIPADREAATATNAQAPSPDFTTPGWFNLNTYQPEKQVKYDKESLVLHEAVPGHVFQITLAEAQASLPDIRKFYHNSAYIEGWALYAESLGSQLGLYRDPSHRFGQLASERFRAVRLVVDTGIHEMGWTREQALQYFHEHAPEESVAEIDRYISWPAQALSYKMGQLRIRGLRDEAQQRLGAKFDVREFNDAVLQEGTLPLEVLTEQMQHFIAAAGSKQTPSD
ncbi:MAG: hypothetical protein JWP08_2576 [Bryobacterales bacterium]|nr:hypothetical protein [Bryobacterales bacterium]